MHHRPVETGGATRAAEEPDAYGPMKVACEQLVTENTASSMIARPGPIVGPDDDSGRFSYWPDRLARGGEVLAPGSPDDVVQVIDVRDLAAWLLEACGARTTGVVDAVGEVVPISRILDEVASGVDATPELTWVTSDFLVEQGVEPWAGEGSLPLWLPRPEYDEMMSLDPQREREVLAAWHARLHPDGVPLARAEVHPRSPAS